MARRVIPTPSLTKETFRKMMADVCPQDAEQDEEMKRLLERLNKVAKQGE